MVTEGESAVVACCSKMHLTKGTVGALAKLILVVCAYCSHRWAYLHLKSALTGFKSRNQVLYLQRAHNIR